MINSFAPFDPSQVDVVLPHDSGYPAHIAAGDTRDVLMQVCGAAARDFPNHLWIEEKDRRERARFNDEHGLWAMNRIDRYTNQNPTDECTTHGYRVNFEACWNRQRGVSYHDGPKVNFRYPESAKLGSLWISCLSLYAEANPGIRGGAGVRQILEIALRRGALPDLTQPSGIRYKHAITGTQGQGNSNQSHGAWIRLSDFPQGWEETAAYLAPDEIIFPEDEEQAICLLLHGNSVTVGRSGHCITWCQWNPDQQIALYPDSYNVTRADSLRTMRGCAGGGYSIVSTRRPDDPTKLLPDNLVLTS